MDKKTVIALGFFDGVHLGHAALLKCARERARQLHCTSAAFTFDRSPREFVTGVSVPLLTTTAERTALICGLYGMDEVYSEPFDRKMMTMPWEEFITKLLLEKYHAVHLVAGHDYRFGHKNAGDPEKLRTRCRELGIGCDIIPAVVREGITVSSTYIRGLIEEGDAARAADFLGHPFAMSGMVKHGEGIGSRKLFPTANLAPEAHRVLPKRGVYATRCTVEGAGSYPGVTNVGVRPTVSSSERVSVESYLDGFSGDLYGRRLTVEYLARLRDEQRFETTEALRAQIAHDIAAAREYNR